MTPVEILHKYFGYDAFRSVQEDVITSVLNGQDTLALLPTGGGKSLCFQVPTLLLGEQDEHKRLCLVITPLIALMKDQVENLKRRGILAEAIYSGLRLDRQHAVLDNCLFGPYHFLYISPERLQSEDFRKRLIHLPIGLIAVDEAHCISQWGYDFRPSYLHIGSIRDSLHCPILALTATATPAVVEDIQQRLGFAQPHVIRTSFARSNLQYTVRYCRDNEHKDEQLRHILSRVPGSAIVYVRNRKRAEQLAAALGVMFYHAGLDSQERARRQLAWKNWSEGQDLHARIIVCTNAFGMGIDKADVRLVLHYDLPDSIEAYFQEAGRAGRDGLRAFAVLLYAPQDRTKARKRVHDNYPDKEVVEQVYHKVSDFLQVGAGSGLGHTFIFHMDQFLHVMHLPLLATQSALHILSNAGYILYQEEHETRARVRIDVPIRQLRTFDLSTQQDELLQRMMRTYSGILTDLQYWQGELDEHTHQLLAGLAARHIITYIPRTTASTITYLQERQTQIWLSEQVYEQRKDGYVARLKQMVEYAENTTLCRETQLLAYFGQNSPAPCGHCDVCLDHKAQKSG